MQANIVPLKPVAEVEAAIGTEVSIRPADFDLKGVVELLAKGDIRTAGSGRTYLDQWVGKPDDVAATSPTRLADRIKVPVFLAAGGEDERAPIAHSRMMETALREAGVPVETLYFDTEGHGFYEARHRSEFYRRLLAFLARSLGGETADASEDKRSATTAR